MRRGARRAAVAAVLGRDGGGAAGAARRRGWTSARCAARPGCRSARSRRRRRSSLVESVGEPRFTLDVNWDPDTIPAFLALPACEAHGRSLPVDPYLRRAARALPAALRRRGRPQRRRRARAPARGARRGDRRTSARSRAHDAPALAIEAALGGELRPFQRAGVGLRAARPAHVPGRRAGPRQDGPGARRARGGRRLSRRRGLPRQPQAQLAARGRALAAAPLGRRRLGHRHRRAGRRRSRSSTTTSSTPTAPGSRCAGRSALVLDESHYVKNPRAKRTSAVRRLAESLAPDALRLALTGTPVMNHAEELIAQLRILGRLEEFGSGARFARRFQGVGAEERIHWHLRRTLLRAPREGRRAPAAARQAPGRRAGRRSTTSASTGWRRRT